MVARAGTLLRKRLTPVTVSMRPNICQTDLKRQRSFTVLEDFWHSKYFIFIFILSPANRHSKVRRSFPFLSKIDNNGVLCYMIKGTPHLPLCLHWQYASVAGWNLLSLGRITPWGSVICNNTTYWSFKSLFLSAMLLCKNNNSTTKKHKTANSRGQ